MTPKEISQLARIQTRLADIAEIENGYTKEKRRLNEIKQEILARYPAPAGDPKLAQTIGGRPQ